MLHSRTFVHSTTSASAFCKSLLNKPVYRTMAPYERLNKADAGTQKHARLLSRDCSAAASGQRQLPTVALPPLSQGTAAGGVDLALDHIGVGRFHFFLLLCVSLIWAGDAMEVMVVAYMGPASACQFGFSATQQSLLSSVVFGGMVLGAASWGVAADALGRKKTLLMSCSVIVAAGLASAAAPSYEVLLLSRAFVGFGLAGAPVGFTLLVELLPAASRGTWGTLVELAWTAGTVLEAVLAWCLLNGFGWRPLLLLSVGPLVLMLILAQHLPESPRYLLAEGDTAAAQKVLQQIAEINGKHLLFAADAAAEGLPEVNHLLQQQQQQQQQQSKIQLDLWHGTDSERQDLLPRHQQDKEPRVVDSGTDTRQHTHCSSDTLSTADKLSKDHDGKASSSCNSLQQQLHHQPPIVLNIDPPRGAELPSSTSPNTASPETPSGNPEAAAAGTNQQLKSPQDISAVANRCDVHRLDSSDEPLRSAQTVPATTQQNSTGHDDDAVHQQASSAACNASSQQQPLRYHQLQLLLSEVQLAAATLSKAPYRSTTLLLLCAWVATTFTYYGLVQLVAQLHLEGGAGGADGAVCVDGMLQVPSQQHLSVLGTSAAEVPAVAWAAVSSNWLGRRVSIATSLALVAVCLAPCIMAAGLGGAAGVEGDAAAAGAASLAGAGMFGARLFIMAAFTLLWVFTPELFPTHVRAVGLGINNAAARIGGLLSPFVAINLVSLGFPGTAEGVFAAAALAACIAVLAISSQHEAGGSMEEDTQLE